MVCHMCKVATVVCTLPHLRRTSEECPEANTAEYCYCTVAVALFGRQHK